MKKKKGGGGRGGGGGVPMQVKGRGGESVVVDGSGVLVSLGGGEANKWRTIRIWSGR